MSDQIAFGHNCTWWDDADHVAMDDGFAVCPHCGETVHFTPASLWWRKVEAQDRELPGYRQRIERSRDLCFETQVELLDYLAGAVTPPSPFRERQGRRIGPGTGRVTRWLRGWGKRWLHQ